MRVDGEVNVVCSRGGMMGESFQGAVISYVFVTLYNAAQTRCSECCNECG